MGRSKWKIDDILPTSPLKPKGSRETLKQKVKGGEVAIKKGRKGKGGKEKRGEGVEKDKGDGIKWEYGRDYGREDKAGKGGRGIYSEDD